MPEANDRLNSKTSVVDFYELKNDDSGPVFLDIKTGAEGQSSVTNVKLDTKILVKGKEGSFEAPIQIGTNADLDGKKLKIKSLLTDLSPNTNDTFIEISLTGGVSDYRHTINKTVSSEGESVFYTAAIEFFKVNL